MPLLGKMFQPVAVERHHAGFGSGEKCGNEEQNGKCAQQRTYGYFIQRAVTF
jgi:hypothetical protein